ncbi:trichodiene synthase [Aspergillus steynii IBT 23096]|uniref:Trichodiene synthase n=1 Tax=Aspergillus steynii IBT 23096 TaxID=1392250 RepID=A0A2I2G0R1_9EURO|nr:trichodiene synthase [Aspergillus steynii IBT 23096]PLB46472.1 trichodiene synthase [Aspergillus steynii IBT 23096]
MLDKDFPVDYFVGTMVRLLDTIQHNDENYTHDERVKTLHYVYTQAASHFNQPCVRCTLDIRPQKLQAALETVTGMVVYSWVKASPGLMAALTVHYTYALFLDDGKDDPFPTMGSFFNDMADGKVQQNPWLRLVNGHFPNLLNRYGPFCALNIYRSTIDFFEGCWIEQYHFHGYRGAEDFPDFSRRMTGLGHAVGASIWPAEMFDEQRYFREITTAICMMGNWIVWINDLISFYKEFYDERDQTSLVNNYSHVDGISTTEALEKLIQDTLRESVQIMSVFKDKHPLILETLTRFMHGYVTWHLCDQRYRVNEIYEQVDRKSEVGRKFCRYFEKANKVGRIDPAEWAVPAVAGFSGSKELPDSAPKAYAEQNGLVTPPMIEL